MKYFRVELSLPLADDSGRVSLKSLDEIRPLVAKAAFIADRKESDAGVGCGCRDVGWVCHFIEDANRIAEKLRAEWPDYVRVREVEG